MIQPPKAGQKIRAAPIAEMARILNRLESGGGAARGAGLEAGIWITGINKTGADLRLGDIAAIDVDDPTPWPEDPALNFPGGPVVILREPEAEDSNRIVVCANGIPEDCSGSVCVFGVCLARVQEWDGSGDPPEYADVDTDGSASAPTVLKYTPGGAVRVVCEMGETSDSGSGAAENWALVIVRDQRLPLVYELTDDEADEEVPLQALERDGTLVGSEFTVKTLAD